MLFDGSDETARRSRTRGRCRSRSTIVAQDGAAAADGLEHAPTITNGRRGSARRAFTRPGVAATSFTRSRPNPTTMPLSQRECEYGRRFAAVRIEAGQRSWATQFHPEKSGDDRDAHCSVTLSESIPCRGNGRSCLRWILVPVDRPAREGQVVRLAPRRLRRADGVRRRSGRSDARRRFDAGQARGGSMSSISTPRSTAATRTLASHRGDLRQRRREGADRRGRALASNGASERFAADCDATRVVIGSAAVEHPEVVADLLNATSCIPVRWRWVSTPGVATRCHSRLDRRDRARS